MSQEPIDLTPNKDGGVVKQIIKPGDGVSKPVTGTIVKVHYVGTLQSNGEKFDSSRDRGDYFSFTLGRGQVIKGWDIGVASMTKGEIAILTIKSEYGYGISGSPPKIPSEATLVFEIELHDWEAEDISPEKDGSILRTVIVEGTKHSNPADTSLVTAHITGKYDGVEFYNREVCFAIGEGSEVGLPEGVDRALRRFQLGEKSKILLKGSRFTYGKYPPHGTTMGINAPVEFTIFLKNFEKVPSSWEMTYEEKIQSALDAKQRGTIFFQQGKYRLAHNKYKRIEDILEYEKSEDEDKKKEREALLISAYLNLALVAQKLDEQLECIKWCDKALELYPNNVKALYRKAGAFLTQSENDAALQIYQNIVSLEPENKAAAQQIMVTKNKMREQNERDKRRYKSLFTKIADEPVASTSGEPHELGPSTSGASSA